VQRRTFWAIQALVLLIAVLHTWVEVAHVLEESSPLYLVPTTLYLIPTVYAAAQFGVRGAVLTSAWCGLLVVLNLVAWHDGLERLGELIQMLWIGVAAVFVGTRVDRERKARVEAERREAALAASEGRYQSIFDNVEEPILLVDGNGVVQEVNQAAVDLLGHEHAWLRGGALTGPAERSIGLRLLVDGERDIGGTPIRLGNPARWFEVVPLRSYGQTESDVVQIVLRDVTSSYEREQGLEHIVREALADREEEQRRIARNLHDGPLQSVMQLWRRLDSMATTMPDSERQSVVEAREAASTVADELRQVSRDLRPSVLDDLGISAAVRSEAESLEQRAQIAVSVRVSGKTRRIEEDVELALLRITQEAVRNIERHSGASHVDIYLEFERARIRLIISDDGVGLVPMPSASQLLAQGHLGLIGMQERARLVGGRLEFSSEPGQGLTIKVTLLGHEIPH
jgi:PAS domain S-box-containing protein